MIICVIKDSLVESYHVPVFCANAAVAIRIFATECNRAAADNPIFTNRGDFDLLKIGEYYEESGTLIPCDPVVLAHGRDVPRPERDMAVWPC